jgi:hypothetical protein
VQIRQNGRRKHVAGAMAMFCWVIWISAHDGVGSPDGRLCTTLIAPGRRDYRTVYAALAHGRFCALCFVLCALCFLLCAGFQPPATTV